MTPWQKRARFVVAIFGIAVAVIAYSAIRERNMAAPVAILKRLDPRAILETSAGLLQQVRGDKQDYFLTYDHQIAQEGGATKLTGPKISVMKRDGRDFVVSAREAT